MNLQAMGIDPISNPLNSFNMSSFAQPFNGNHEVVNNDGEEMKETAGGGDGGRKTTCCKLFLPSNYFQLFAQTLHFFEWRTRITCLTRGCTVVDR